MYLDRFLAAQLAELPMELFASLSLSTIQRFVFASVPGVTT